MKKLLLGVLPLMLLISCKKSIDELPDPSQNGSNTFGAKINGNLWGPMGFGAFPANDILEAVRAGDDYVIRARNFASSPNETEMHLTIYNVTGPGVYQLNTNVTHPNGAASYGYYVKRNLTPTNEYLTSSTYTGTVTITKLDTVNKIISGTFEFSANGIITPEVIVVTEGRFDVKYM